MCAYLLVLYQYLYIGSLEKTGRNHISQTWEKPSDLGKQLPNLDKLLDAE